MPGSGSNLTRSSTNFKKNLDRLVIILSVSRF